MIRKIKLFSNILFATMLFLCMNIGHTEIKEVSLSQKIDFKQGDIIKLKDNNFTVLIGYNPGSECAVPGFNCGSGYIPPHLTYKIECGTIKPCPYNILSANDHKMGGSLTIEDEASCMKLNVSTCMPIFSAQITNDLDCTKLKTLVARYYCLQKFTDSKRPENKNLCDQLPDSIYALKWNCFYEYAIRYRDPSFCDKYSSLEFSGRDRCLLKMAETIKDPSLCEKISKTKEHSYKEQCLSISFNRL